MDISKTSNWDSASHTNSKAEIIAHTKFNGKLAIEVKNAYIRKAKISGIFQIAEVDNPFTVKNGVLRVEVECMWEGKKPKSSWMHLIIKNKYKILLNHKGSVVSNVGKVI
jgi:hypothetical protein